jgi:multicomponent Na+:H+ antiporter subunit D
VIDPTAWPALVIMIPLAGAVVATLAGRFAAPAAGVTTLLTTAAAAALALAVRRSAPLVHTAGGWTAPLGIELHADGLAATLVGVTAIVGIAVVAYAGVYFDAAPHDDAGADAPARAAHYFWPLWLFLWSSLNAVFLTADIFNAYVALELLSIAAIGMVALDGTPAATAAAMRYMIISLLGSLLYLLGVALLYRTAGTLSFAVLAALAPTGGMAYFALVSMTVGLALKTALFPLHAWLPPAHASAPAPGSAILSALVVKGSFVLMLRVWLGIFPAATMGAPAVVLGALGAGAVLWGSLLALRQRALKPLIAYSTVAQLGYLFLIFPLWAYSPELALAGGMMHLIAHACSKAAMFLAAGAMVRALGGDGLDSIAGVGARMPLAFAAFGLGGLNLAGLPPSGGFLGKWLLLSAAIEGGQWLWAGVLAAGSLLAAGYVFIVLRAAFLRVDAPPQTRPIRRRLEIVAFLLALVPLGLGIWALEPTALILSSPLLRPGAPSKRCAPPTCCRSWSCSARSCPG